MHYFFFLPLEQLPSAVVKQVTEQWHNIAVCVYLIPCASVLHSAAHAKSRKLSFETPSVGSGRSLAQLLEKVKSSDNMGQHFFLPDFSHVCLWSLALRVSSFTKRRGACGGWGVDESIKMILNAVRIFKAEQLVK